MVERDGALSVRRQCALLGIHRSSVYYTPREKRAANLALMRRMDELSLQYPFYGSRQMARHLGREGALVGRRRVRRLMRLMGLEALYRKPRTSAAQPGHRIYPYLLRELTIDRPDQVWCADITYIPVTAGFLYLVAVMDWASRHVLAWRLSNTMDTSFCIEALEAALRTGTPEIFNTDQGAQFTSTTFTERVLAAGAQCSMDGRGRCLDNVFIERLLVPTVAACARRAFRGTRVVARRNALPLRRRRPHRPARRVGSWRAAGRGRWLIPALSRRAAVRHPWARFQLPPRQTQHAALRHWAFLLPSPQGLCGRSSRECFRQVDDPVL